MGQLLHGSTRTTQAVRRALQSSQESLRALAARYGINQKTVRKWRRREQVEDRKTGQGIHGPPCSRPSRKPSSQRSAGIRCCRSMTVFTRFRPPSPRSLALRFTAACCAMVSAACPRCRATSPRAASSTAIRSAFHMYIAEVRTAEGKLHLFVAIDRTSKFAFVQLLERADMTAVSGFLEALTEAVPYRIHTVLTDNRGSRKLALWVATASSSPICPKTGSGRRPGSGATLFDRVCWSHGIEHRLTKPNHPWTHGQVERMNRTIKDATVSRYHYGTHEQIRRYLNDFILAYNFARKLKTLKGLTPYEYLCKTFLAEPERFRFGPIHQMPGLYT